MLKFFQFFISIFLIGIIFLRVPQESIGLGGSLKKNKLFGSSNSTQNFLNILIAFCVILYFIIAIKLNFS